MNNFMGVALSCGAVRVCLNVGNATRRRRSLGSTTNDERRSQSSGLNELAKVGSRPTSHFLN